LLGNALRSESFILFRVNLGDDRDLLKRQIKEAGITFRSWWDAGGNLHVLVITLMIPVRKRK
jgi:hypothetical protein